MSSILSFLSDKLGAAFVAEGLVAEYGRVQLSDRPDLAQYQCNGALALLTWPEVFSNAVRTYMPHVILWGSRIWLFARPVWLW